MNSGSQTGPSTPWLGICAVLIGVSSSVLTGQLLTVGLADVRGALHLSVDQGAWLGATFNAGQMLTGPLTVYLGGLLGPRRVLLVAAPLAGLAALFAPLSPSYPVLVTLLAVLGVAVGTFYPLTLSFIGRSLPKKYLLFGVATYAFDVIGSLHVAALLEGLYMQHLSWHWVFWTASVLSPAMWFFVWRGMPGGRTAAVDTAKLGPTWAGFLYASLGFTSIFLLLTQGERLDWFRSGTIVALAVTAAFFLLASLVQHLVRPNALVQLNFLWRRNILLLSVCLCGLRFSLLNSALLVPQFLGGVRGELPLQSGAVLAWAALPALICGVVAALSLIRLDPRIVLAGGFAVLSVASFTSSFVASDWSRWNFFAAELMVGIGAGITVCGLVGNIVLELINSGAAKNPVQTLTFVAWFHTVRLLGGQLTTTLLNHLVTVRERFHSNLLGQNITAGSFTARQQFEEMAQALGAARAAALLSLRVRGQALTLSVADGYAAEALTLALLLFVVAAIRRAPLQFRDLARAGGSR